MTPTSITDPLDLDVRRYVYDRAIASGRIPSAAAIAQGLARSADEIEAALQRLAAGRVLVLQRDSGEILMANPFSAIPTPFLVQIGEQTSFGNCIWDALGILAMVGQDGEVQTGCGCCGTAMNARVVGGDLEDAGGIIHFAVPARRWWDNIIYT